MLGWWDERAVYLEPTAAYHEVAAWHREAGNSFGLGEEGLKQALLDQGYVTQHEKGRRTMRKQVNGRRHHVMALDRSKLPFAEHLL